MRVRLLVALLAGTFIPLPAFAQEKVRYDGHMVVRATIASARDLETMLKLSDDVWSEHVGIGQVDFRLRPEAMAELGAAGIAYEVLIDDVQSLIDGESARLANPTGGQGWFDEYKDLAALQEHMRSLSALRPDLARRVAVGPSLEKRSIRGIRISNDAAGAGCKPALVFAAAQHAREWITPMVTMYLADALVTRYDTDPVIKDLVDRVEFYIVPVANPDGYVYTWRADRLWRKNRRPNTGSSCFGVDLNRNWGYQWGLDNGSSGQPCSETYRGPTPFSEPESAALRDFVLARPQVHYLHDMHSYGQLLLQPWGYTNVLPPGHATYDVLGAAMAQLIQAVHGKVYVHGPAYTTIYPASGVATDWAWGAAGNVYSFAFELRGSPGGFMLPPDQIVPNSEEILPAALHLAGWIADQFPCASGSSRPIPSPARPAASAR